ncbi:MAG: polyphenol oxidase family protein [Actinomycetota bacterium]|nr:polyphenol oxidase family protein [Actinomycetota bacterium]
MSRNTYSWAVETGRWRCEVRSTGVADGSFALLDPWPDVERRRLELTGTAWTLLRQVHGTRVVSVSAPGDASGIEADGACTFEPSVPVAVTTADCAPVVMVGSTGVAVVHAGWRGALDGIIETAARVLADGGAVPVETLLGPCIGPSAYEFGAADLADIVAVFGPAVIGRTATGSPALDLPAVVSIACERAGWPAPPRPPCTSDPRYFSHRVRGDTGRQATVAWLEPSAVGPHAATSTVARSR